MVAAARAPAPSGMAGAARAPPPPSGMAAAARAPAPTSRGGESRAWAASGGRWCGGGRRWAAVDDAALGSR